MATYVNDLRLKEIATGDEAGTWGTSTNTNLELIGEALGYGTQDCFVSDANATTTVADGATDPARAMYFKVTSSATLTATRTLTIAPNTISRVMLIENATTGSQSIAISQGSGGNVTIANGAVKMVYLDGAGAGAAVVDALADLELGTITVSDLTATTADINGGTIDGAIIGGASAAAITGTTIIPTTVLSLADNIKATFGTSTELEIYYSSGPNVNLIDSPSAGIQMGASSIQLGSYAGASYALFDNTGVDVTGTVTADGVTISPASGDATLTLSSNASQPWEVYSPDASNDLRFKSDSTDYVTIDTNGNVGIGTSSITNSAGFKRLAINDTSGGILEQQVGGTATGRLITSASAVSLDAITSIPLTFKTAAAERMRIDSSGNVGIGTTSPATRTEIVDTNPILQVRDSTTSAGSAAVTLRMGESDGLGNIENYWDIKVNGSDGALQFIDNWSGGAGTGTRMVISDGGNVGIGTTSPDSALTVLGGGVAEFRVGNIGASANSAIRVSRNDTSVTTGNPLGYLEFGGNDSTSNVDTAFAYVGAEASGTHSAGNNPTELTFGVTTSGSGTPAEAMRLTAGGSLGIGTTSPATRLELSGVKDTSELRLSSTTNDASWSANQYFGKLSFYSADSSGAGAGIKGSIVSACTGGTSGATAHMAFSVASTTTNEVEAMRIDANGNVGIGTTSPTYKTTVEGENDGGALTLAALHNTGTSAGSEARLILAGGNGLTTRHAYISAINGGSSSGNAHALTFATNAASASPQEAMRIDNAGNVGIGTTSPIAASGYANLTLNGNSGGNLHFADNDVKVATITSSLTDLYVQSGAQTIFRNGGFTSGDEAARIDSSGNLLVGKISAAGYSTAGIELRGGSDNYATITKDGGTTLYLNRLTSDGTIADFRKDGASVGTIGSNGSRLSIGDGSAGLLFISGTPNIQPHNMTTNTASDGNIDLGVAAARFQDIYATNGTIQTSDVNEKQDIAELDEAERRVAVAAKGLLRKFRWKSAVAEKGDEARIHFGIIAQDLQAAFETEGLDAGRYAMFTHTTWTDEETGEERSRMGVRYSELLAFIIAAL